MITYEQARADLAYWTLCAEIAERYGESRWVATGWGLGGVCYGEMIRAAMLTMAHCCKEKPGGLLPNVLPNHERCDSLHIGKAIDAVLIDVRRRTLLHQARERRGVI